MQIAHGRAVILMLSLAVSACGAGENGSGSRGLDVKITDEATPADAGLPAYPGAKPYKDSGQSSSGANVGFSTPLFGIKVVGMNLETGDQPDRVAEFYRKALAKYGQVLDCSDAANVSPERDDDESNVLTCDSSDVDSKHSVVFKAGTKDDHRIVAIKPHGAGSRFSLVHVNVRGESKS